MVKCFSNHWKKAYQILAWYDTFKHSLYKTSKYEVNMIPGSLFSFTSRLAIIFLGLIVFC